MAAIGSVNTNNVINALNSAFGKTTNTSASFGYQPGAGYFSNGSAGTIPAYQVSLSSLALNLMSEIVSGNLTASPLDSLGQDLTYLNMSASSNINPTLAGALVNAGTVNSLNFGSNQTFSNSLSSISGAQSNSNLVQQSGLWSTNPSIANSLTGFNSNANNFQGTQPSGGQSFQSFSNSVQGLLANPNSIINFTA
ncbi:MAG: hypothetical protein HQK99_05295 [Nitrospirae bacterium]|nr:hypothetical protein [Nitrospirota bacterium]